jgi:hypothetical protein
MNTNRWNIGLAVALSLVAAGAAQAATGPLDITLRYSPQESVGTSVPALAADISERPVRLSVADGRTGSDPAVIGESTDDDDRNWPVRVKNDLAVWAGEVLTKNAGDWGIRTAPDAPLTLAGKLTRFHVSESNKALGSTYNADIAVSFTLADSRGRTLWSGTSQGDATRYGKSRSEENVNEVLSDAIKEAYANALAEPALQDAWLGKSTAGSASSASSSSAPAAKPMAPSELLSELVKLKKQGFGTDLLVDYVKQHSLNATLSADDLVKWKQAGMPDEVIKTALDRAGS